MTDIFSLSDNVQLARCFSARLSSCFSVCQLTALTVLNWSANAYFKSKQLIYSCILRSCRFFGTSKCQLIMRTILRLMTNKSERAWNCGGKVGCAPAVFSNKWCGRLFRGCDDGKMGQLLGRFLVQDRSFRALCAREHYIVR